MVRSRRFDGAGVDRELRIWNSDFFEGSGLRGLMLRVDDLFAFRFLMAGEILDCLGPRLCTHTLAILACP